MSRLGSVFREGRRNLAVFLTAGYPEPGLDEELALAVLEAGADILELGVPFSDPLADGPRIQAASATALRQGMTLEGVLGLATRLRRRSAAPLVLMGYANPFYRMGYGTFARRAAEAGVDGVLVPDLPLEAGGELRRATAECGVDLLPMAAPGTEGPRLERMVKKGSGFLYLVSMSGITGDALDPEGGWQATAAAARSLGRLPVCLGFGISSPAQVKQAVEHADGAVVGSAVLRRVAEELPRGREAVLEGVSRLVASLADFPRAP